MITSKPRFFIASLLLSGIGMTSARAQAPAPNLWSILFPPAPAQVMPQKQAPNPWNVFSPPAPPPATPVAAAPRNQAQTSAPGPNPFSFLFPSAPLKSTPAAMPQKPAQTSAPAPNPWNFLSSPPALAQAPAPMAAPPLQVQPVFPPAPSYTPPPVTYTPPPVPTFTPPPAPASTYVPPPIPVITLPPLPGFAPPQATPAAPAPPVAKTEEIPPVPAPSLERLGKSLQNYFTEDEIKLLFEYMQESVLAAFKGEEVALAPDLAFKLEVLYVRIQKESNLYMSQLMQQLGRDLDKAIKEQLAPKPPVPPAAPQKNRAPAGYMGSVRAL